MSLAECIPEMVASGEIDAARAGEMLDLYSEMLEFYRRSMGEGPAAARASEKTLEQLEFDAAHRKYQTLLQVKAQADALANVRKFSRGGDVLNPRGAIALLVRDDRASYANVEYRWRNIRGQAHARIDQILANHSTNVLGQVRQRAELEDIVRELFDQNTGSAYARQMADGWREAGEMLRRRFNAAGGNIGKLEGWGLPQSHDSRSIDEAGFEEWRDFTAARLDRDKMIDERTGLPFTDEGLDASLRAVWDAIRTEGWSKRAPGASGGRKLANRNAEHRFLHFKNADGWIEYNNRFGGSDPFASMMSHIDMMSRDIALMEILGPNPAATVKWLSDNLEQTAALTGGQKDRQQAFKGGQQLQRIFDEVMGRHNRPENRKLALAFSAIRNWQSATKLGSAVLSTTSDQATSALTRGFNGLPQMDTIRDTLKYLNPANKADRSLAVRAGLIAEEWSSRAASQNRFLGEELTGEVSRRMAEGVMRIQGLSAVTQAGRWAMGMEFMSTITANRGKPFGKLDKAFRGFFERYGLDAAEWDVIRAAPLVEERGAKWILPDNIADRRVRDRLMEGIMTEVDFAVPTGGLEIKAAINSSLRRGTWLGELGRTAFQFKSFPVTIMLMHGRRMLANASWGKGAQYAAALVIFTTLSGAVSLQMKEVSKGKDPRPMDNWAFWGAALLQGGGLGIFGDFLGSSTNRFGGSFTDTLAGPAYQTVDTAASIVIGDQVQRVDNALSDDPDAKEPNTAKKGVRALKSEVPGGSLWYARLAFERLILDQLAEQVDPDYRTHRLRMEREAEKMGQGYWWAPGETAPERAPELVGS
ncbi:hypothetical protein [Sphingomonas turrisvirgatae]|uniref:Uncharacterized protein n=1 Tax=Sphingomonas turrisvirgatae TaxID=1888892 RepID=A0A1E3LZT6_9SPHN|nr:hypothetical protein [Sphingomonas turrisvirgatae]ODP39249.1 hypothetical protein BFL28_10575 [Sphingomonas turrisvirgatae]